MFYNKIKLWYRGVVGVVKVKIFYLKKFSCLLVGKLRNWKKCFGNWCLDKKVWIIFFEVEMYLREIKIKYVFFVVKLWVRWMLVILLVRLYIYCLV